MHQCVSVQLGRLKTGGALVGNWEFYASTLFFICLCCCFSVLCGLSEVRRKKKGITFAQAWSIPQAMPVLRTWPRRSVSVSDAMTDLARDGGEGWTPLSEDQDDLKRYPVAGLVDDTAVTFGFVATMPQSLLGNVSASLRRQGSIPPPITTEPPQEPELTVWISREGASAHPMGLVSESPRGGLEGRNDVPLGRIDTNEDRSLTMLNNLQQPLISERMLPSNVQIGDAVGEGSSSISACRTRDEQIGVTVL